MILNISDSFEIKYGVTQGLVFEHILFLIYINDIL